MGTSTKNYNTPARRVARMLLANWRMGKAANKGTPAPIVRVGVDFTRVRRWSEDRAIRRLARDGTVIAPVDARITYTRA